MIRTASTRDAASIAALSGQLGYPAGADEIRQRIEQVLRRTDNRLWVAESAGEVAGWLQAAARLLIESAVYAEIVGLVVDEKHRGQGVGSGLVRQAEDWAVQAGYGALRVRTNVLREDARRFYGRQGFEKVKQQAVLVKKL